MKLYERIENNNFDEIDKNRAIELIEGGNGHLVYNENYFKLQKENEELHKEIDRMKSLDIYKLVKDWETGQLIPIQKVKDKIEELKKKVEELTDEQGYWGGSDLLEQIKVLEEILEKEQ